MQKIRSGSGLADRTSAALENATTPLLPLTDGSPCGTASAEGAQVLPHATTIDKPVESVIVKGLVLQMADPNSSRKFN